MSYDRIHDELGGGSGPSFRKSYKESVLGDKGDVNDELSCSEDEEWAEADGEGDSDASLGEKEIPEPVELAISIVKNKRGTHDYPALVLSEREEKRIHRPWRKGVIIKLLGCKIGFKVLETRLKQLWVRKGIIQIIDLSNDFFLVTFSSSEDHEFALTGFFTKMV